jgi:hypothetical protein
MTRMAKTIKVAGLASLMGAPLIAVAQAVLTGLTGNAAYPNPSVDPAVLKVAVDGYTAALAAALDGGKTALMERDAKRVPLIRILQNLASYVEHNCAGWTEFSNRVRPPFLERSNIFSGQIWCVWRRTQRYPPHR